MKTKIYVIICRGHGKTTKDKWSPIFKTATKLGDLEFLPGERFLEYYFNDPVSLLLERKLIKRGIPAAQLVEGEFDMPLSARRTKQSIIHEKAKEAGFLPVTISIHANDWLKGTVWNRAQGLETFHKSTCEDSKRLATIIQSQAIQMRKRYQPFHSRIDRGVKTANFYIFRNYKGIVVLPESEFMSNIETLKLLCTDSFIEDTAEAYCHALEEFQNVERITHMNPKQSKKV